MKVRCNSPPDVYRPVSYWDERALRFAAQGDGLAAVCSYGMPGFYNRAIDLTQRIALAPWLNVGSRTRVLDVGCGVGRWSRMLASRGARVTGIDLSAAMITQARKRAQAAGIADRCRFLVQDFSKLDLDAKFDLVLGVTVLQHILDPLALRSGLQRMSAHLAAGGSIVLLEAAPTLPLHRCDSTVFTARPRDAYVRLFAESGLRVQTITGVDPAPFRVRLLPHLRRLPPLAGIAAMAAATALSLPIDIVFGRLAVRRSWHAVFVLRPMQECSTCA